MVTFTIHIPQMLAYIPYMDPMGMWYAAENPDSCRIFSVRESKLGTSKIGWSILQIDPNLWCPGPYMLICSCWFVSPTVLPCLPIQGRKSESIPRLIINCPISGYAVPWIDSTPLLLMVVHLGHIPHGIHACLCLKSQLDLLSHNIPYVCW